MAVILVTGLVEIANDDLADALAAARVMMEASEAEDGCLCYRFYADIAQPNRIRVFERWRDEQSLQAHFRMPHTRAFLRHLAKSRILSREIRKFTLESDGELL